MGSDAERRGRHSQPEIGNERNKKKTPSLPSQVEEKFEFEVVTVKGKITNRVKHKAIQQIWKKVTG